jgi:folate-dependent phosphoribosylglycinamide formyltransferase PurN
MTIDEQLAYRRKGIVETLSARILAEEHRAYPEAFALVVGGGYEIVGR